MHSEPASSRLTTREQILEVSLKLFNEQGYAATSLAEIAANAGIAKGNLTYHFPSKRDLAVALEERARHTGREIRSSPLPDRDLVDGYVQSIRAGIRHAWEHRFLFRDQAQYLDEAAERRADPDLNADIRALHKTLLRMQAASMFRSDTHVDLPALARTLSIVTRFWMDHLRETEGRVNLSASDLDRGLQQHLAVLSPCFTAPARRRFEAALERITQIQPPVS